MSINEMMTLDTATRVIPFEEAMEGWKWVGSTLKDMINQDHETINKQNEGFMDLVVNPETVDDRYNDASQHIREIREYKRGLMKDVIASVTIISLALCGVRNINITR